MAAVGVSDNEDNEDTEPADDDQDFMKLLADEIEKVTSFYVSKASFSSHCC